MQIQDTIAALATAPGAGAIAVIRVSGENAIDIVSSIFDAKSGKILKDQDTHTLHLGNIKDDNRIIDEALVSIFKGKRSYTG
ncbi:MAG: tRNA uridine-5-carboxymethylaminomethyl(34) synthesis GTPase MnmE, partial [Leeuwenhoekiella marinoflava]